MTWLEGMLPPPEKIDAWQGSVMELRDKLKEFEINNKYAAMSRERISSLKEWFDERLDKAIKATEEGDQAEGEQSTTVAVQQAESGKATTILQRMSAGKMLTN